MLIIKKYFLWRDIPEWLLKLLNRSSNLKVYRILLKWVFQKWKIKLHLKYHLSNREDKYYTSSSVNNSVDSCRHLSETV